jgi:hypothetical protein
MHRHDQESLIISTLEEGHTVTAGCKRAGVSRQLFYRLCKSRTEFRKKVDQAKALGNDTLDDLAQTMLNKKMKDGHWQALLYALKKLDKKKDEKPVGQISEGDIRFLIEALPEPYKTQHWTHLRELLDHSVEFEQTGKIDPPDPDGL